MMPDKEVSQGKLACPFYKYNPKLARWRSCKPPGSDKAFKASGIKEHLKKKHQREYFCKSCKTYFEDKTAHRSTKSCKAKADEYVAHGIRPDTMAKLYEDKGMPYQIKDGEAGKWMQFWEILFPGKPRPATPYYDTDGFLTVTPEDFQEHSSGAYPDASTPSDHDVSNASGSDTNVESVVQEQSQQSTDCGEDSYIPIDPRLLEYDEAVVNERDGGLVEQKTRLEYQ